MEILVARDDHGPQAAARRLARERADHVVRLEALHAQHGHVERVEHLRDALHRPVEILLQLLVQFFPGRLVQGVALVAERLTDIVHPGDVLGPVFFQEAEQEIGHAPDGGRVLTTARGEGPRDHREKRAVDEGVPVDQENRRRRGGHGAEYRRE